MTEPVIPRPSLGCRLAVSPDVVARKIGNEFLLVPIRRQGKDVQSIYALNPVAASVWGWLDGKRSLADIRELVLERYEVEPATAEKDLLALAAQLFEIGAVTVSGESSSRQ